MHWMIICGLVAGGLATVALALAVLRLSGYRPSPDHEPEPSGEFSMDRYQPMMRLLAEDDFLFLTAQPGYRPEIGARLRRDRRRIFRMYLRELTGDFHSLHARARAIVAESEEQHAGLVGLLMRQHVTFWYAMMGVELRLAAHGLGLGKVDLRGLFQTIESMRRDLERSAAPAAV